MAQLNTMILGEVNGKLGNLVFRQINGKTYVSNRPRNYKPTKSQTAKKVRGSFAAASKLASLVNADKTISEVWKAAKIGGNDPYHKIIKYNTRLVKEGSLTEKNKITPDGLFLKIESASLQNQVLHLSLNCPEENNLEFPAKLLLLYYSGKSRTPMVLTQVTIPESTSGGIYELDLKPAKSIVKLLNEDPDALLFAALVSETPVKKKAYWTSTASAKLS